MTSSPLDITLGVPLKPDKVKWPTEKKRRRKIGRTSYCKQDHDNDVFDLDYININRNELIIWANASLSLDAYLQRRYAESLETIIPPHMRPSHMRLYAHETYIEMITKLQNDNVNNKFFYDKIGIVKISEMMKRSLLHGEDITTIIDGVVRKIRFCAIELVDKYLRNSIKPLYTLCREAAILVEHVIYEIRKIIEEILLALINIYRSVGHLNLEKQNYLGEIESLSKLLVTVCESAEETEDEKNIKRELQDDENIKKTSNNNNNNNNLITELVERFGIPVDDVEAILKKYSYAKSKKPKQRKTDNTFVTAVNDLKKVNEDDKENNNSDEDDNETEDESADEGSDEEDENEVVSRVSESLVDESMHLQINFEQTLLRLGEESQKYQIGLANAIKQTKLDKTDEARKTFLSGNKLIKELSIETDEVVKLRKQVDQTNRMHIATLEQQIKIMQGQLEKVKESILTPKEKEILRLKKLEREVEQKVQGWVSKHKDHHGRILRRNLLLYYLKYRFAKRKLIIASIRIQRVVRNGMVLLLLRKNMKRIYKKLWADKVLKSFLLLCALDKRLKHKNARLLQKAMRRFVLRSKFKKILYASRKILMQRTAEIIGSVVSQFDKRMKVMELFLENCIPEDIVANVRIKIYSDYDEVRTRKGVIDEGHPFWKEMQLIRQDVKQLSNRLIVTESKADTMKYAVTTSLRAEKFNYEYDDFVVDDEFEQWQAEKAAIKRKKMEKIEHDIYEKMKLKNKMADIVLNKRRPSRVGSIDIGKRRTSTSSIVSNEGTADVDDIIPSNLTADQLQKLDGFMKSGNADDDDSDSASSASSIGSLSSVGSRHSLTQSNSKASIGRSGSSSLIRKGSVGAIHIGKKKKSTSSLHNKNDKKKGKKRRKKKRDYDIDLDDNDYPQANNNFKAYDDMVKRGKWISKEKLLQKIECLNQFSVVLKKVYEENDLLHFKETAIAVKGLELLTKEEEQDERDIADERRKRSFQGFERRGVINDGESSLLKGMIRDPLNEMKGSINRTKLETAKSKLEILNEKLMETEENMIKFKEIASKKVESNVKIDDAVDTSNIYQNVKFAQLLKYVNLDFNDLNNVQERKIRKGQWVNRVIEDSINQIFIMLSNLRMMPLVSATDPPSVSPLGMDYSKRPMNEYELTIYTSLLHGLSPPVKHLFKFELITRKPFERPSKSMLLDDSMRKGYNRVLSLLPERLPIDDTNTNHYQEKRIMRIDGEVEEIDVVELSIAGATNINCSEMLAKAITLIRGVELSSDIVLDLISASNFNKTDKNTERKKINLPPLELLHNLTNSSSKGSSLIFSLYILKLCTIVENRSNQDKTLTNIPDKMNLSNAIKILQYIYLGCPFKKCKPAKIIVQTLDTYPIAFQHLILTLLSMVGITMPKNSAGEVIPLNSSKKMSFVISDPLAMLEATAEVPETNVSVIFEENKIVTPVSPKKHAAHPPNKSKPSNETTTGLSLRHVSLSQPEELSTFIRKNINAIDDLENDTQVDDDTDIIFSENSNSNIEQSPTRRGTSYMTLYAYRRYLQNKLYKEQMLELTRQHQLEAGDAIIETTPKVASDINNMIKANEFLDIAKLSPYHFAECFLETHEKQSKLLEFAIKVNTYFRMAGAANILTRVDFVRIIQSINNVEINDSIIKDYYAKSLISFNTSSMDFKCFHYAVKSLINDNIIKPIM